MEEVQKAASHLDFQRSLFKLKSKVYGSCVQSYMMYGSETWPMKKWHESILERTEMRMVRWMCGIYLFEREKKSSAELRDRMDIEVVF